MPLAIPAPFNDWIQSWRDMLTGLLTGRDHTAQGHEITTRDVIKALAVIIMVCDHIGYYFYPDNPWWRAFGRIGFPVWFFFAGYSRTGGFSHQLIPGILAIMLAKAICLGTVLPLNALVTILIIRYLITLIPPDFYLRTPDKFISVLVAGVLATLFYGPTNMLFEYGSVGLFFGYLGYACYHTPDSLKRRILALTAFMAFIISQYQGFHMQTWPHAAIALSSIGTAITCLWLYHFKSGPASGQLYLRWCGPLWRGLGRHTLLIYTGHIVLFLILRQIFFRH